MKAYIIIMMMIFVTGSIVLAIDSEGKPETYPFYIVDSVAKPNSNRLSEGKQVQDIGKISLMIDENSGEKREVWSLSYMKIKNSPYMKRAYALTYDEENQRVYVVTGYKLDNYFVVFEFDVEALMNKNDAVLPLKAKNRFCLPSDFIPYLIAIEGFAVELKNNELLIRVSNGMRYQIVKCNIKTKEWAWIEKNSKPENET